MKTKNHKKSSVKSLALLGLAALVATAGIVWFVNRPKTSQTTTAPQTSTTAPTNDNINYNPPTEQDKQEAVVNKEELGQPSSPTTTGSAVTPVITTLGEYDNAVEVSGFVQNVYEDDGVCKYTFSKDGTLVTRQTTGFKDVQKTVCPPAIIPRTDFKQGGTWKVTLSYKSSSANGTSSERSIEL